MARTVMIVGPTGGGTIYEDGTEEYAVPPYGYFAEDQPAVAEGNIPEIQHHRQQQGESQ